ncbi:MAG TPA: transcriptional repressor LexA [Pyrinomonadaceae bacterium]|nr:transcriptional repressor LexA [Pyrinomonadaceae bacterium]
MQTRTKRQKQVYDYIKQYIDKHGYEPSYQQIAWHLGVRSKAGVAKHIAALENLGLLSRRKENGSFILDLTNNQVLSDAVCEIEWLDGAIFPDEPEEWQRVPLIVPRFLIGYYHPENLAAMMVFNDSMSHDLIFDGDIAIIEKRSFARDGDIVAAEMSGKNIVIKRFYRNGADIELRPSNDEFTAHRVSADKVIVRGIYRGVLRPFG